MRLTLPYPPSANVYWRSNRGRVHRSNEANAYRDEVAWLCKTQGINPYQRNVCVSVAFYRPRKVGDLDNGLKCLLDSLKGHAFVDDRQVVEIHATRHEDKHDPRVEIVITEAAP